MLTNWAEDLDVVGWLLFLGGLLGYVLGSWKGKWYTHLPITVLLGSLIFSFLSISMLSQSAGLEAKSLEVWNRINTAAAQLSGGLPVTDSILFVLAVGFLFWWIAVATGLLVMRTGKLWIPILLLGIGLLVIEHYQPEPRRIFYSWAYAGICLILLGRHFYLNKKSEIENQGETIGSDTEFDFSRGIVLSAVFISLLALILPGFTHLFINRSKEPTQYSQKWDAISSNFENAFFAIGQTQLSQEEQIADDFSLGTGQISGTDPVLFIQVNSQGPLEIPSYWRGKVYSTYANKTWSLGNSYKQSYPPVSKINAQDSMGHGVKVKVWVQTLLPELSQVYTIGDVISFNRRINAAVATETIYEKDVLGYFIEPAITENEIYRFETVVFTPSFGQLMEAGENYPDWVSQRYLQVPDSVSTRMINLSKAITQGKETPFDKAAAITQHLRANYQYQPVIQAPPRKADPVDWFLFEYKKGFCNYYASAEVLLLRIAGVPARLAVGYAHKTYSDLAKGFTVQRNESHAWPEVYFPGYGWIPFEPTASMPDLNWTKRSVDNINKTPIIGSDSDYSDQATGLSGEDRANMILEQLDSEIVSTLPQSRELSVLGYVAVGLAGIIFVSGSLMAGIWIRKNPSLIKKSWNMNFTRFQRWVFKIPILGFWLQTSGLSMVQRNFSSIEFGLRLFGENIRQGNTPAELSLKLKERIPGIEEEIDMLLRDYQIATYSQTPVSTDEGKKTAKKIRRASWKLWRDGMMSRFKKPFERFG